MRDRDGQKSGKSIGEWTIQRVRNEGESRMVVRPQGVRENMLNLCVVSTSVWPPDCQSD